MKLTNVDKIVFKIYFEMITGEMRQMNIYFITRYKKKAIV